MTKSFYLDTSIWMDAYEDRKGFKNEPLGKYASSLLAYIVAANGRVLITDHLIKELESNYTMEEIRGMMKFFENLMEKIIVNEKQKKEARKIALERDVPYGDVLHAVIARDLDYILITRDRHFIKLKDISEAQTPEDILP